MCQAIVQLRNGMGCSDNTVPLCYNLLPVSTLLNNLTASDMWYVMIYFDTSPQECDCCSFLSISSLLCFLKFKVGVLWALTAEDLQRVTKENGTEILCLWIPDTFQAAELDISTRLEMQIIIRFSLFLNSFPTKWQTQSLPPCLLWLTTAETYWPSLKSLKCHSYNPSLPTDQ